VADDVVGQAVPMRRCTALYLRYGLSYRDVEALPAKRGIEVDHGSIYR
jgi:transposase-like protein